MTDIFREIEEDLRRDRLTALWTRHGNTIVVAAALVVLAVAGWRYWTHVQEQRAGAAGARFEEAVGLSRDGKSGEAEKVLQGLLSDAPAGYRTLARLRLAAEAGKSDAKAGATAFEALASDPSVQQPLQELARLRAAMLRLDTADPKEIAAKVEGLAQAGNPWRNSARELLGLAAMKAGDYDAAGRWFDRIVVDPEAPSSLRQRAQLYLALVRAGPVTSASTQ